MNWIHVVWKGPTSGCCERANEYRRSTKRLLRTQEGFCSTVVVLWIAVLVQVSKKCVPSLYGKLEISLRLFIARHGGHMTRPQTLATEHSVCSSVYNIRQYRPKDWQIFASRHGVTS
jgi:hypothetical protein